MKEYAHSNMEPQSEYVRFRGVSGQIDIKDSVVAILSAKPGSTATDVADLIFDKVKLPRSYTQVHGVLANLVSDEVIVQNGDFFYLIGDALEHDMKVVKNAFDNLNEAGFENKTITFLSSGLVMAAEAAVATEEGRNYDPMYTVAADPVSEEVEDDEDEYEDDDWDDDEDFDENEVIGNPFDLLTDSETEEIKEQSINQIKEEAAIEAKKEKAKVLRTITDATQLLGKEVEIQIPGVTSRVIGTILELRATGCNFLITYSEDDNISEGTVMPLEYSRGFTYKLID